MIIDELIAILGYDVKGEGELDRFNRGLDRTERKAAVVAARMNAIGVAIGSFVGIIAARGAMRLGSMIGSLPGDVLKVGQEFENLETVLTTIEGSSTKAKEAMDWVQDFAATTPYDLGQVSEAFVRMRAYGLDPMNGLMKSVGDAAAGMGKGLMQGVEAVADAVTGENERLKEFGIKTKVEGDKITYNWNENGKEMSKTVRKNGPEIIAALTEIFGRFDGAMDELSKTQAGIIANLGDSWTGFLKKIGEKGYYDEVTRRLGGVKDTIDKWEKDGILDRVAESFSGIFTGAIEAGAHIGNQIWTIGKGAFYAADGIVELISRVTGLNKAASAGVLGAAVLGSSSFGRAAMLALARKIPAIAALLLADDIITGLSGGDSYVGTLDGGAEALEGVKQHFTEMREAATELASALHEVFGISIDGSFLSSPGEFIDRELVRFLHDLAQVFRDLAAAIDAVRSAAEKIAEKWKGFRDGSEIKVPEPGTPGDILNRLSGGRILGGNREQPSAETPVIHPDIDIPTIRPDVESPTIRPKVELQSDRHPLVRDPAPNTPADYFDRIRQWMNDADLKRFFLGAAADPDHDAKENFRISLAGKPDERTGALSEGIISAGETIKSALSSAGSYIAEGAAAYAADREKKGDRVFTQEPDPDRFGEAAPQASGMDQLRTMLENANANLAKMVPERAIQATVTDARQDNRQFPVTVNSTVNQTVTQAAQAPTAAARATGNAVGQAAAQRASRFEMEPAF